MFQNNNDKTNLSQQRSQLQPSAQTEIQSSLFKKAAVEFYSRNEIKLNVLKLVTEYKKFMSSSGVDNSDENKETDTTTSSDENQNKKKETVDLPSKSAPSIPTHNIKLKIIQKIMTAKGIDISDQQTILILCQKSEDGNQQNTDLE